MVHNFGTQGRLFDMPPEEVFQYLLLISPISIVNERLWEEKRRLATEFNFQQALHAAPHITVIGIYMDESHDELHVQQLQKLTSQFPPLVIDLNGFGSFGNHTIYAKVEDKSGLLMEYMRVIHLYFGIIFKSAIPHITIARGLPRKIHGLAFPEFSVRAFKYSFTSTEILFLKRRNERHKFKELAKFTLHGNP
jgi:2'-5' RNA ligase